MIRILLILSFFFGTGALAGSRFRLHLMNEPTSLSPFVQKNSSSLYLFGQLNCPLLRWYDERIEPAGAECRFRKKNQVECRIDAELRFQNGEPVLAEHYRKSFLAFLDPKTPSPRAEILYAIKNAKAYLLGKKKESDVGIKAKDRVLSFELETNDRDFFLSLANPLLTAVWSTEIPAPQNAKSYVSCGAYQIESWEANKKIVLAPNPKAINAHAARPTLEYLFISEDALALQAYQKNELDFLRRLPTLYLGQWENSAELFKIDQIRFDSLILAPEFRDPALGQALAQSIDFEAWRKLYRAKPRPGCFGLPEAWTEGPVCWDFDVTKAKAAFAKIKNDPRLRRLRLFYSKQGGDDHDRTVEFLQSQWSKNLGLEVKLEAQENKIFLETLKQGKAPFFRKGLSPERPSCLAVLENFDPASNENYAHFSDPELQKILQEMREAPEKKQASLCRKAVLLLRDRALLIPTGPLYFSLLAKPQWEGWRLNALNHLDLSGLHPKK